MRVSIVRKMPVDDFIKIVEESTGITQVAERCGLSPRGSNRNTIKRRIDELCLDTSHFTRSGINWISKDKSWSTAKYTLDEILIKDSWYQNTSFLKKRILKAKLLEERCYICNSSPIWRNKRLVLILDHINGDRKDHRIKNLRLVCPNCDSQLDTYKSKNK